MLSLFALLNVAGAKRVAPRPSLSSDVASLIDSPAAFVQSGLFLGISDECLWAFIGAAYHQWSRGSAIWTQT